MLTGSPSGHVASLTLSMSMEVKACDLCMATLTKGRRKSEGNSNHGDIEAVLRQIVYPKEHTIHIIIVRELGIIIVASREYFFTFFNIQNKPVHSSILRVRIYRSCRLSHLSRELQVNHDGGGGGCFFLLIHNRKN